MIAFKYDMGAKVKLVASGEEGDVIGRAQHANTKDQYLVLYMAADGRQVEAWWYEDQITTAL